MVVEAENTNNQEISVPFRDFGYSLLALRVIRCSNITAAFFCHDFCMLQVHRSMNRLQIQLQPFKFPENAHLAKPTEVSSDLSISQMQFSEINKSGLLCRRRSKTRTPCRADQFRINIGMDTYRRNVVLGKGGLK